jgi:FixJ family two-component response regulator
MFQVPNRAVAVVDDDSAVIDSLQDLLESGGYSVRSFLSAEEFLDSDALPIIGCLISDIELPKMDGWSLETVVMHRRPFLPIVFVTAHGDVEQLRKRKASNGVPRIMFRKPFDGRRLLEAVHAVFLNIAE